MQRVRAPKPSATFGLMKWYYLMLLATQMNRTARRYRLLHGINKNLLNYDLRQMLESFNVRDESVGFHQLSWRGILWRTALESSIARTLWRNAGVDFLSSCLRLRIVLFMAATHAFQSNPLSLRSKDGKFSWRKSKNKQVCNSELSIICVSYILFLDVIKLKQVHVTKPGQLGILQALKSKEGQILFSPSLREILYLKMNKKRSKHKNRTWKENVTMYLVLILWSAE